MKLCKSTIATTLYTAFFISSISIANNFNTSVFDIDFDISMKQDSFYGWCMKTPHPDFYKAAFPREPIDLYNLLKELYKKNNLTSTPQNQNIRIPKIIHQIWLGGQLPDKLKAWQKTWIEKHPDWQYKLWTDDDAKTLNLYNHQLYLNIDRLASKADILSYEILYKFGGVYIDSDFECLRPLDILHYNYDFYVGVQPLDINCLALGHGIVGCIPHHPIIKSCMEIQRNAFANNAKIISEAFGPLVLTKAFLAIASINSEHIIALPSTYFYPLECTQKYFKQTAIKNLCCPESFGIHYWMDGSDCKDNSY